MAVVSTLDSDRVRCALAQIRAAGEAEDGRAKQRVRAREAALGVGLYGVERAELGAAAPLAVSPEVGSVLYALVLARRPAVVVEFGASLGASTIYLASALRDSGAGRLITTELLADKAARAAGHVRAAGLDDLVEFRVGDARDTLASVAGPVELLFLDGSNDLYLEVLELLEPRLSARALVLADMSLGDPHHQRYRSYVNARFLTTELSLDAGLVVSTQPF